MDLERQPPSSSSDSVKLTSTSLPNSTSPLVSPVSTTSSGRKRTSSSSSSSWWEVLSPTKSFLEMNPFSFGHRRTPSVPIPSIQINTPSEDPSLPRVGSTVTSTSEGDINKGPNRRRLERSVSAFDYSGSGESNKGSGGPSGTSRSSSTDDTKPPGPGDPEEVDLQKKPSPSPKFLSPLSRNPTIKRQRSKSYSDLFRNKDEGDGKLPELTLAEAKKILQEHRQNKNKNDPNIPTPPPLPPTPAPRQNPTTSLLSTGLLLPAASLASLDGRLAAGIKKLRPVSKEVRWGSSYNLNQEGQDGPNSHTSPILHGQGQPYSPFNFFIPQYFRRASQLSTVSQGLILAESMVSLTNRALVSFIVEDNFTGLQHLLESRRVAVDDRDENGGTALMVAASKGKSNFVRSLLEHGADINAEDADNWTALTFAAKEGHDEIVSDLLDHGATVDHRDMGSWTPLIWACYKGRTKTALLLIEKGADVNAYGCYTVTCLGWAAGRGHTEIVKELLIHGAKVNVGDKYGTTPLIWAARKGYIEIVDMLLQHEASIDACGMTSWTPLLVASSGNHVECVKSILEHKPNVNALDKDGCSALTIACKEGFHEIAVSLINHGAYINISDRGGTSNLIHAAKGGHRSIVEALLKKHADVNVQGKDKKTALYWAVEKSHVHVVRLLLSVQPDIELCTKDGDTALMKAVRNRNTEIVSLLLDKRAKVSAMDKNGDTCLHIAMRARSKQIVELLLRNPAHSQLLYRPNRAGETPYNIDRTSPKPIIPQIFGSRGLNTQEDGENLLGYNLYSSALADMLSDPTLNMPITVGLFARWGSGKSFLLSKLREEMKSFAKQWLNPTFSWNILILIVILCFASIVGVTAGLALQSVVVGAGFGGGLAIFIHIFLFVIWISSRRSKYDWSWSNRMSSYLASKFEALKLVCQVIFCHPPGAQSTDHMQAQPINFYFTEQTKISSTTGGENSVVQMLGSLYTCIENDYGVMTSRLYRAFRPKPVAATADWKWRKLCCLPYSVVFLVCFICSLISIVVLAMHLTNMGPDGYTTSLSIVMYTSALIVGLVLVANLYTIGQVLKAIIFSHRRHLQRTVSKLYAVKAEGFLHSLKSEVNLMTDMIRCLDAFTSRQTRMVVIVDGLDSAEQEKVLQVLDAVHILFSDTKAPFIILLAIDPHIITKGIEMNINPVLNESNIGGQDYLRNLVHLPFFLQNAALRKVKHVKMLENSMKRNSRLEEDPGPQIILSTRRPSVESGFGIPLSLDPKYDKSSSKKPKRLGLKMSESIASSLGSNLNRVTSGIGIGMSLASGGPSDLKKMLLGDDYFSDVNPRSMRRLMNIIHITGRLLKCFSIDFNWYHLSAWVNVTEQWPYRLSWMIIYCEHFQKDLDDGMSLKSIYERVRCFIPTSKDIDANVALDRDEKKLDIYLGMHKASLLVSTLYVFLPFTISLDPQLRKDITEQYQPSDQIFKSTLPPIPAGSGQFPQASSALRYRGGPGPGPQQRIPLQPQHHQNPLMSNGVPPQLYFNPNMNMNMGLPPYGPQMWYPNQAPPQFQLPVQNPIMEVINSNTSSVIDPNLAKELKSKRLSSMGVEGVCDLLVALNGIKSSQLTRYQEAVRKNNINGRVLLTCDLAELKLVLQMTFGDWEMFKAGVLLLRDMENRGYLTEKPSLIDDNANASSNKHIRISVTSPSTTTSPVGGADKPQVSKSPLAREDSSAAADTKKPPTGQQQQPHPQSQPQQQQQLVRPNVLEKQVTMEEQMICGALELLNDEAKEDAIRKGEETPSSLSPINSEPENNVVDTRKSSRSSYLPEGETDVLYVMGTSLNVTAELPDSPSVVRKLSEVENANKFMVLNESQQHLNNPVPKSSDPIPISGAKSPRTRAGSASGGSRAIRTGSLSKNLSFSENVTMLSGSPSKGGGGPTMVSRSLGTKDYSYPNPTKSGSRMSMSKSPSGKDRKVSRSFAAQMARESSSDASSDESQKPLVMKPIPGDKYRKGPVIRPSGSSLQGQGSGPGPPTTQSPPKKKKGVQREDSIVAKLSTKIKSSLFGGGGHSPHSQDSTGSQGQGQGQEGGSSSSYRPLPLQEDNNNHYHYNPPDNQGEPWTAYRAPTPGILPHVQSSEEFYQVIKSSNPSPTTSNESEIGSSPEHISSKEELFLPGPPPDLPESPYQTVIPRRDVRPRPSTSRAHFIPPHPPPPPLNSSKIKVATSSGEEAVSRGLKRTRMNRSDPVLASSSACSSISHLPSMFQFQPISTYPHHQDHVVDIELSSMNQDEEGGRRARGNVISPPLLVRQSAIGDPSNNSPSSREDTPKKQ